MHLMAIRHVTRPNDAYAVSLPRLCVPMTYDCIRDSCCIEYDVHGIKLEVGCVAMIVHMTDNAPKQAAKNQQMKTRLSS